MLHEQYTGFRQSFIFYQSYLTSIYLFSWKTHGGAAIVNAFFSPNENSIQFPAGILDGLFFQVNKIGIMKWHMNLISLLIVVCTIHILITNTAYTGKIGTWLKIYHLNLFTTKTASFNETFIAIKGIS